MSALSVEELESISKSEDETIKLLLGHIEYLNKELQAANDLIGGNVHPLEVEVAALKNKLGRTNELLSNTCGPVALEDLRQQCKRAEDKVFKAKGLILAMRNAIKFGCGTADNQAVLVKRANKWLNNPDNQI